MSAGFELMRQMARLRSVFPALARDTTGRVMGTRCASFTWSSKPAAAEAAGVTVRISDVGVGGSLWISDGIRWRPVSHSLCLLSTVAASGLLFDTTTTSEIAVPGAAITLPGGVIYPGDSIRLLARATIAGPGGAGSAGATNRYVRLKHGNAVLVGVGNAASGVVSWAADKCGSAMTQTSFRYPANSVLGGASATQADAISAPNLAADAVLGLFAQASADSSIILYNAAAYLEIGS